MLQDCLLYSLFDTTLISPIKPTFSLKQLFVQQSAEHFHLVSPISSTFLLWKLLLGILFILDWWNMFGYYIFKFSIVLMLKFILFRKREEDLRLQGCPEKQFSLQLPRILEGVTMILFSLWLRWNWTRDFWYQAVEMEL